MSRKANNFRAWQFQNPNGTVKDAWNAAWEGQNALQYSRKIQRLEDEVRGMKGIANTQAEIIDEQNQEIQRLREALEWYAEQTRLARLIRSEGDKGRNALAADGGKKARAALAGKEVSDV